MKERAQLKVRVSSVPVKNSPAPSCNFFFPVHIEPDTTKGSLSLEGQLRLGDCTVRSSEGSQASQP